MPASAPNPVDDIPIHKYVAVDGRQRNFFDADLARLIDAFLKQVIIHHGARMQVFWVGAELAGEIAEADRRDCRS